MAHTAMIADKSSIALPGVALHLGPYTYRFLSNSNGLFTEINDGSRSISKPVTWAFGDASVGQSYLYDEDGKYYEARFTYFASLHAFDLTPGRIDGAPISMSMAAGRPVSDREVIKCFACHTTGMTSDPALHPEGLILGVTCEACHGPGENHASDPSQASSIFNPQKLTPADSVDFCGSCHGTWWDTELMGATGMQTVRFPAYRLEKSRCWGRGDARLTCVACHDPHQPLVHEASAYDQRCLACHLNSGDAKIVANRPGKSCPVANKNCTTCHMPKYELPEMHAKFTDHEIRVVHAGEAFPD